MSEKTCILVVTHLRGQYRYLQYLRGVTGWKLHPSGQYFPVLLAAIVTVVLLKYVSIKCKQTQKNFWKIYHTLLNIVFIFWLAKAWIRFSEDITGRWRDEGIAVSSFLSITHGLIISLFCIPKGVGLVPKCVRFYILLLPI